MDSADPRDRWNRLVGGPCAIHQLQPLGFSGVTPGLGHSGSLQGPRAAAHMDACYLGDSLETQIWVVAVATTAPPAALTLTLSPLSNGAGEQEAA